MAYKYKSVFAQEIVDYLELLSKAERYTARIQSALRSFDKYLSTYHLTQKSLDSETITSWSKSRDVGVRTKAEDISRMRGFAKYLISLGIKADYLEAPKIQYEYTPYVFSDIEIDRIIKIADNFEINRKFTRSTWVFPILLRILYGCGLRLGEGRSLRWMDINLESGLITIRESKNLKQRFVPMDDSLTAILTDYREFTKINNICDDFVFESDFAPGTPFKNNTFYEWFIRVINGAGIHYAKSNNRQRGPCPHCLRHCFTMESFLKSEREGRRFDETAPVLATYLGHDSAIETEAYLRSHHSVYTQSHQRVNVAIGYLFPEVDFNES
jgi:integrase